MTTTLHTCLSHGLPAPLCWFAFPHTRYLSFCTSPHLHLFHLRRTPIGSQRTPPPLAHDSLSPSLRSAAHTVCTTLQSVSHLPHTLQTPRHLHIPPLSTPVDTLSVCFLWTSVLFTYSLGQDVSLPRLTLPLGLCLSHTHYLCTHTRRRTHTYPTCPRCFTSCVAAPCHLLSLTRCLSPQDHVLHARTLSHGS